MKTVTIIPARKSIEFPKKLKVAAYCRVSTMQEMQCHSIEAQREFFKNYIEKQAGWEFVGIYADQASGRYNKKMKDFQKMLVDCRNGKINKILVKSISRLGRNTVEFLQAVEFFNVLKIDVFFEVENLHCYDKRAVKMLTIYASLYQQESESKSFATRWGHQVRFESGDSKLYNRPCYGYKKNKNGLLEIIPEQAAIQIEELDSDESIINFRNGILKISDGSLKLLPHSPEYLSTIQIPCEWSDKKIPTPVFDKYMKTLTNGDKDVENLLLEFMGAVISNVKGYRMKKALFMVGPGDTGKSQLKALCEKLIGPENYSGCELSDLEERFGTSDLYCKRLIGSADASGMKVKEFKTFKKLTGGDTIRAEFKGLKAFNFTFNGLMWLCMNVLPKFGGDNGPWVYERIMIVSCNNVIPKNKQDKQLLEKMYAEKEGIIAKAIKALLKVIENGYRFDEPKSITEMREKYMNDNNTVVTFFEECMCQRAENQSFDDCTTGKIYRAYKVWCRNNYPGFSETERDFRSKIAKIIGGEYRDAVVRRNGSSFFKCFTLTLETKRDYCTANA